ncbi:MAG: FAD-dependent monooxygenase, partial [Pseudohongiellaceae bacterium]
MNDTVIIAGAGPVGLTLALLLHQQGRNVRVYEAVTGIRPLGVGINLLPHSVRVLSQLGLGAALDGTAIRTSALHYYNKFGQQIWAEPRGLDAGYQFPQYSIHRGELQLLLLKEVQQRIGPDALVTGHKLCGWQSQGDSIHIDFTLSDRSNAKTQTISVTGACLIAADGINSTARKIVYPDEGPPIYGGRILWRGVTRADPFLDGRTMFMAGHRDCKFVAYPIARLPDGRVLTNWIAELSVPEYSQDIQDWNKQVAIEVFKGPFQGWRFPWVDIPALIEQAERVYEFPLSDRNPLPRWTFDRMTLIGDAAHPMYPIGSNGASQGILDAEK